MLSISGFMQVHQGLFGANPAKSIQRELLYILAVAVPYYINKIMLKGRKCSTGLGQEGHTSRYVCMHRWHLSVVNVCGEYCNGNQNQGVHEAKFPTSLLKKKMQISQLGNHQP